MEQIEIKRFLLDKGIPPHVKGFEYLMLALDMCQNDKRYLHELTKSLYRDIANKCGETTTRTERAMRHALTFLPKHITIGGFLSLSLVEMEEVVFNKKRRHFYD